jgi:hypothetical protein
MSIISELTQLRTNNKCLKATNTFSPKTQKYFIQVQHLDGDVENDIPNAVSFP